MIRLCVGDDAGQISAWLSRYRGQRPTFACVLSFTETGLIDCISAAGKTANDRRYTAQLDGEFLLADESALKAAQQSPLPKLAAGVSPAVITRAVLRSSFGRALRSRPIPTHLLSTGLPAALRVPHVALPAVQAQAIHTGHAMTLSQAQALFRAGLYWGKQLAPIGSYLIVGECVVGGTTTAQAVLSALGYAVAGRMSSSHLAGNHRQKQTLVEQGLLAWKQNAWEQERGAWKGDSLSVTIPALAAVAAVGDPMQLVVAGMALAASQRSGVLLAGGAQMLAVYALAQALAQQAQIPWQPQQVVVGTTRWVVEDESADTVAIAHQLKAPYLASEINFSQSPYVRLRAYEQGFVKEGVGAGGCAIAAHLYQGWSCSQLRHAVEAQLRYV